MIEGLEDFEDIPDDVLDLMENADTGVMLPQRYLSFSQINLYMVCAERYRRNYVLRAPRRRSSNMAHGSLVHKVLEEMHLFKMNTKEAPPKSFHHDVLSQRLDEYFTDLETWDEKIPTKKAAEDVGRELLDIYYEDRIHSVEVRDVERRITSLLRGRIPFLGYVDLIEKGPMDVHSDDNTEEIITIRPTDGVRDVKVTGRKYAPTRVENSLQLSLYAEILGVEDVGFDLLVQKAKSEYVPQRSTRSPREKEHALDVVESVADAISQGVFPKADPESWACNKKWCPFWDDCRGRTFQIAAPTVPVISTPE